MFEIGPFQYTFKKNSYASSSIAPVKKIFTKTPINILDRELVVITGASGAGKSTLLQILKGIIPEYSTGEFEGKVLYRGGMISGELFRKNLKQILFLFQNPFSQLIHPDVPEEFFFSMENFNFSQKEMDQKKVELNDFFNLDDFWNKKTCDLSHGECQRLVLASLLAIDPEVLLMDEPTAFLDPEAREHFYNWLKKIKGTKTIILVDHYLEQVLPLADRVINVSSEGEVAVQGVDSLLSSEIVSSFISNSINSAYSKVELKLSNISFHYPEQIKMLEDASLLASSSEVVVIKGKNGQGKSTLFKIIAGILKPLKGSVGITKNNFEIPLKKRDKEIGFVFQNPESHFFYDTIKEELKSVEDKPELKRLLDVFLDGVDLNRSPFLLSEGEKRRLSILMTVFLDKSIILYDEPTFGQDQQSIAVIVELIKYLKAMGKIQIIISHDESFIDSIADKTYELKSGKLERLR